MPYISSVERRSIQKGMREGLLEGIAMGLELKFGSEGLTILPEISQIQDVDILRVILTSIKTVNTLEELRQIYH
ncbi:hypothetical protein ACF3DV_17415 [Chlorogloeopsis fritschii PCC 9212]|uniref:Uncharacterized protein n=1 Tax=Chlorogloeopsis fritschii PCC 6912 TaxID=211165 RepID=A0A3S1A424_CHLFR|nr:hypothetical protein [Chlorogloeopsis fritschii]RUR85116.1 hypothetical protein PCC6912_12320 [Chlorogloeopsis fritschii PCC 6912]